jgi:hypothetical protein
MLLIAETNEDGEVCYVWQKQPDDRVAQPVKRYAQVESSLSRADFSGATPEAIRRFLQALRDA